MSVEVNFFNKFQNSFQSLLFLIYFNKAVLLYINIDALKEREFDVMTYHSLKTKLEGLSLDESPLSTVTKPIIFLSKTLSFTETRY